MEKKHPIQIIDLQVRKLELLVHDPIECRKENQEAVVVLKHGNTSFDEEQEVIVIGFLCEINKNLNEDSYKPFEMCVELFGIFSVGSEFPKDKIEHWSNHNAPYILLPYIRENVTGLLARAGIRFHLPLVQIIR